MAIEREADALALRHRRLRGKPVPVRWCRDGFAAALTMLPWLSSVVASLVAAFAFALVVPSGVGVGPFPLEALGVLLLLLFAAAGGRSSCLGLRALEEGQELRDFWILHSSLEVPLELCDALSYLRLRSCFTSYRDVGVESLVCSAQLCPTYAPIAMRRRHHEVSFQDLRPAVLGREQDEA